MPDIASTTTGAGQANYGGRPGPRGRGRAGSGASAVRARSPCPWDEGDDRSGQGIAAAVRDFERYIADGLATDLRVYLHWLEERRSPTPEDRLPDL
ncbi:hypothetical protein ACIRST_20340 [Kitasatospora sp. NPDC101447]|uniref:hypothetical protein n=1 Tax=Kitasatospora sp. NPDC101447 TaxID=3364102 RepID=UPI00381B258A